MGLSIFDILGAIVIALVLFFVFKPRKNKKLQAWQEPTYTPEASTITSKPYDRKSSLTNGSTVYFRKGKAYNSPSCDHSSLLNWVVIYTLLTPEDRAYAQEQGGYTPHKDLPLEDSDEPQQSSVNSSSSSTDANVGAAVMADPSPSEPVRVSTPDPTPAPAPDPSPGPSCGGGGGCGGGV